MKKKDLFIYFFIVLLFVFSFFMFPKSNTDTNTAQVFVNKELFAEYSLLNNGVYTIEGEDNIILNLKIENGKAFVLDVNCNDKMCKLTGSISKAHESIICLPGKIVITLDGDNVKYDGLSW